MLKKFATAAGALGPVDQPEQATDLLSAMDLKPETRIGNEAAIRQLCHSVYLGNDMALCRILGRHKIYVDCRDIGIAPHLMLDGYWEMWVTEALVSLVEPGMVVADIGANLGYFSLLLADIVGPTGRVHAFEPNPRMAALMRHSVSINGMSGYVHVHQLALGIEDKGEVALVVPPEDPKNAHIVPIGEHMPHDAVVVPLARLDGNSEWSTIQFAKIDVEGAERLVWDGAQGLIDNGMLKTVVLEFTADRYPDPEDFLQKLQASGFRLSYIHLTQGIIDITPAELLQFDESIDIMLVLRR